MGACVAHRWWRWGNVGPVIGGWGHRQQLSSRPPPQKAPRMQAIEAHAMQTCGRQKENASRPSGTPNVWIPRRAELPGQLARLPLPPGGRQGQREMGWGFGAAPAGNAGQSRGMAQASDPVLQGPYYENSFLHPAPSFSSSRGHQTLPEIFPDLAGTCCSHHMPESF